MDIVVLDCGRVMEYSPEAVEVILAAIREWQAAKRDLDWAMQAWTNAPLERERALVDRVSAAEAVLLAL